MKVAVIGATGVLGRHLVPRLIEAGHEVRATYLKDADAARLDALGASAVKADILAPASLASAVAGCNAAIHIAKRIPPPGPDADWRENDRIRRDGTAALIAACRQAGCRRYLQQSVAMILSTADDRPQTEDDPVAGPAHLASAVDAEALVRASGLDWRIVRGGLFYGPGTSLDDRWRSAARNGTLRAPGDGSSYLSLVHIADMAAATVAVLETGMSESVWNAVHDEPVPVGTLFAHVAGAEGAAPPEHGALAGPASFRVSNAWIKSALGWSPCYPSWRRGLPR